MTQSGNACENGWPLIAARAIRLSVEREFRGDIRVAFCEEESRALFGKTAVESAVLRVRFAFGEGESCDLFLMPIRTMSYVLDGTETLVPPRVLTVTPHVVALMREEAYTDSSVSTAEGTAHTLRKRVFSVVSRVLDTGENEREILSNHEICTGLAVIDSTSRPNYVMLEAALSGSRVPDPDSIAAAADGRMVILTIVPDTGPVRVLWIKPAKSDAEYMLDERLYELYGEALDKIEPVNGNEIERRSIFRTTHSGMDKAIGDLSLPFDATGNKYRSELLRMLGLEETFSPDDGSMDIFGEYIPKITRDTLCDYRPALADTVAALPDAVPENAAKLAVLLAEYEARAAENPGMYEEGRVMLGADRSQYVPSDDECIAGEIGDRLCELASVLTVEGLGRIIAERGIGRGRISYMKISYRHADAMGSGRFFYANAPVETEIVPGTNPDE